MFILKIIGALAALFLVFVFMEWFNRSTYEPYNVHFFNKESFAYYAASYIVFFIGWEMMDSHWDGDALNGIIIMFIGAAIMLKRIHDNFKSVPPMVAFKATLLQMIIFAPLSMAALFALIALFAAASGVKPVYNLNCKD